ncbi:DUF5591 domain-containing protein [Baia soyae]|uniref:DUF5591 domain-containing protein n=1 Tax=Baia soyae TaxID=1544746 RepID=A0A4R2RT33_9BACL|nr:DUF5591 domain-containing protein [Baia soyae]TCP66513.1 hypothetical protein EDD57_12218 [Baia soyae]
MSEQTYPGYSEYILKEIVPSDKVVYKRGANREYIHHEEFAAWHQYFCSESYQPPVGKKIALLHTCTWGKPYDQSYIGHKIKGITDQFPLVHRIVLSNAGIIPYEYQLNPTFCAYDWKFDYTQDEQEQQEIIAEYRKVLTQRLQNYLTAHKDTYQAVILLGIPSLNMMSPQYKEICNQLGMPFMVAPRAATYRNLKEEILQLQDIGEFFTNPAVLEDLKMLLSQVSSHVTDINHHTSIS